jgi:hypothetical protein
MYAKFLGLDGDAPPRPSNRTHTYVVALRKVCKTDIMNTAVALGLELEQNAEF